MIASHLSRPVPWPPPQIHTHQQQPAAGATHTHSCPPARVVGGVGGLGGWVFNPPRPLLLATKRGHTALPHSPSLPPSRIFRCGAFGVTEAPRFFVQKRAWPCVVQRVRAPRAARSAACRCRCRRPGPFCVRILWREASNPTALFTPSFLCAAGVRARARVLSCGAAWRGNGSTLHPGPPRAPAPAALVTHTHNPALSLSPPPLLVPSQIGPPHMAPRPH
jgi:hypothetical protein